VKKHISMTQLTMLWRCGEQYRRRYVKGERIPPGIALITGTATHRGIELNLKHKIEKNELLPIDVVEDIAREEVIKRWEQGVLLEPEEKSRGEKVVKGEVIDVSTKLAKVHRVNLAPKLNPKSIEKPFALDIKENNEYGVKGVIDIIETKGEKKEIIRDTKTAARVQKDAAEKSLQLTMYALAEKVNGNKPSELYIDFLHKTKFEIITQKTKRTNADFEVLLNRIANGLKQLQAGIFPPSNPDQWWCSKKFCGYYDSCPFVKRAK